MSYTEATPEALISRHFATGQEAPPVYRPPTAEFVAALQNPGRIEIGRAAYAAYTLPSTNPDAGDLPPLIALKSFNNVTVRSSTARTLSALAQNTGRTVISIDRVGKGDLSYGPSVLECFGTSFDSLAYAHAQVLARMKVSAVDLVGICTGAVLAAHIAVRLGEQARGLVTFNSVGFEHDTLPKLRKRMHNMGPEAEASKQADALAEKMAEAQDKRSAGVVDMDSLPRIPDSRHKESLVYGVLGLALTIGQPMLQMPDRLAPETRWHDFVGEADGMADPRIHRIIIAERDRRHPGSSAFTLLRGVGHNWPLFRTPLLAKLVDIELSGLDKHV